METFKHRLFIIMLLWIVICKGDDSMLNMLLKKVDTLERKGIELEEKVNVYTALTAKLQEELQEKDRIIGEMKLQVHGFKESIRELQTRQHKTKLGTDTMPSNFDSNDNFLGKRKDSSDNSGQNNVSSPDDRKQFDTDSYILLKRQAFAQGEIVVFHAVNNHGEISHIGINQNIVFETVLLNVHNAYHPQHGVFIAPIAGLYIFSTSILSYNGQKTALFAADMVKNGALLARVYGHGDSMYYDQGSVTVITQLVSGDEVWVRLNVARMTHSLVDIIQALLVRY